MTDALDQIAESLGTFEEGQHDVSHDRVNTADVDLDRDVQEEYDGGL